MSSKLIVFGLFILISGIVGERENVTVVKENENQERSNRDLIYKGLIVCAFRYDAGCFMNVAQNFLDLKRTQLLAQADQEVARATGSTSVQAKPSQVAQTIEKLFSDLAGLFRDGFSSLFSSKDDDDDLSSEKNNDAERDDDDDEDDDKKDGNTSRDVGEARKKKKKKKKKAIKIFAIASAIIAKLGLLVKLLQAGLLFKIALTTVGILGVSVAKLIFLVKHGKQKTIYYENSHHDHHYEHDDIYENDEHHGWGRSANDIAYSKQIPKVL